MTLPDSLRLPPDCLHFVEVAIRLWNAIDVVKPSKSRDWKVLSGDWYGEIVRIASMFMDLDCSVDIHGGELADTRKAANAGGYGMMEPSRRISSKPSVMAIVFVHSIKVSSSTSVK